MSEETQTAPASASTGTVEEAASKIEALLSGKKPTRKQEPPATEAASETPAESDNIARAEDVTPEDDAGETASEADEADDEPAENSPDSNEDEAESSSDEEPTITVELDGKNVALTKKEIQEGYLRLSDYTRKTQALAAERKQFSSDLETAKQQSEVYAQLLPALVQRMQSMMPQPPDRSLIHTNPSAYLEQKEAYEEALGDLQAAQSEQQRLKVEETEQQTRKLQAYVAENASKLTELIPEWKDQKAYERDRPKVRDYLRSVGFSDDEINQAYDARLVKLAADGMRWRDLRNSKPRPVAPSTDKPLRPMPPPAQPVARKSRESMEARKRLASSGRVEDAALAIKALL